MERLREHLAFLKREHSLVGIKGGTEVEAQSFEEIWFMRRISKGIVPLTVKIAGPEARNDIEFMLAAEIDCILAPMVESAYSLKNFVATMAALDPKRQSELAVNIETITAWRNLKEMFDSPAFAAIRQVTVGRSDLSGSMGLDVDDDEVTRISDAIVMAAQLRGKRTSIGGQVSSENALLVKKNLKADTINTRHMAVDLASESIAEDVAAALLWEKEYYLALKEYFPSRRSFYMSRIASIEERAAAAFAAEDKKFSMFEAPTPTLAFTGS
jgi:hypothetical protein